MGDLLVKRWVRYGHDRTYVESADGHRLGYVNNVTGDVVVDDEKNRPAVSAAVAVPTAAPTAAALAPARPPTVAPAATVALVEQPWTDLATNPPGEAARLQAVAHRQAAPVKTALARILGAHTKERAWRIGADGEEAVAARLARLGDAWRILHAVPVGVRGSDIDHVVIGPGGVYTVNTKNHPDAKIWVGANTVMVNRNKTPYVRNSRHEAARASALLSQAVGHPVPVTGLIAIMGARGGFVVKSQPPGGDVHVVKRREVANWLSRRGPVLTPEQVEAIFALARRSTTWLPAR